jgi:hypothetical protein
MQGTGTVQTGASGQYDGHAADTDYICQVYDSSGGTDCNVATPGTAIPFDAQTNVDSMFTHSTTTNPSRVTCTRPGLYKITYSISWEDSDANRRDVRSYCRINGTTTLTPSAAYAYGRNTTDAEATNSTTFLTTLSANDYVEVMCEQAGTAGTAPTIADESWLLIEFVR